MSEEQEQDFTKLSIEERCSHKNWKARLSGYESLTALFQELDDEKSPEFVKYAPIVKKLVIDSNAAAQEKGLSAVLAFAENYSQAGKYVEGIISGIITKCLISPKVKTRELSHEIVLMYVEIEKQDAVVEELIKGLDNKTPKIVAASVSLIKQCLNQFGVKVINIKPIVKIIPRLLEDRDKNIREEGKQLSIEVFRWIKDALKPQLQNLKAVQLQELEAEFEKVKNEKAVQLRLLRSQQVRVEEEVPLDQLDGNAGSSQMPSEDVAIDPYDLLDPVDILSKLPNDFYELCEAKKWQERKEALEKLLELLEKNKKLIPGDYGDLVRQLKKMMAKDTNIIVVTLSVKCLGCLATALRKSFHPYANSCISVIIEKFKEKKQTVVIALREAIDAIIISTSIEAILEDLTTALDNKNPQIKSEMALFLVRTFCNTHPNILSNKKLLKPLSTSLTKTLNDMDATVRDSSAEALGTAMKVVGEKTITPFIQGVDAIKLAKIKEYYDKAQVKIPSTAVMSAAVNSKPPAVKRMPATVAKAPSQESIGGSTEELANETKQTTKKIVTNKSTIVKSKGSVIAKPQANGSSSNTTSSSEQLPDSQNNVNNNKSKFLVKNKNSRQTTTATVKSSKKADEVVSNSPLMPLNKLKDQRLADEKALKVLKWNFTAPREEFYSQLKEQMITADWQQNLINYCFHYDFKFHIKAIDLMKDYLLNGSVEATIANCDLILKWLALRFFDTNPSVLLKALEYLLLIFETYQSHNITLSDAEANSFIPYLVLKSGDPKDAVRNKVHDIISKLKEIYMPSKIFNHLMTGLQSKNARQRTTCLEELANLIEWCGMTVCQTNLPQTMKEIAKLIADRDNGVRNAALNCVVQVYFIEGERVYKHIGHLSDKESSLLEERIKRASKSRLPVVPPQSAPAAVNTAKTPVQEKNERMQTPSPPNMGTLTKSVASAKTGPRHRPKSMGPLSLDLKQIEQQMGTSDKRSIRKFTPPKSIATNYRSRDYIEDNDNIDIDEILNLPDVQIRKSIAQPSMGPITKMINSSPKAEVALNLVMAQLSSQEICAAMEALSQLSQLLDNEAKAEAILDSKVDQLIIMCYMQYRLFLTKHLADQSLPKTDVVNLFRGVTNVLMSLFSKPLLGKKASRDVLRELMSHMVALLVDSKLIELSDSTNIIKSVNLLATTVINGSDPTNMLSALIKLLHDCVSNSINASPKFMEMIMKCLWKMSRNLDNYIDNIDIDRVFFEVHLFLKSFPSFWWKENSKNDIPLRTIKTLTYLIVQQKGDSVLNNLTLIRDRNESELCHYIQKALKQSDKLVNTSLKSNQNISPKIPKSAHNQLITIISKLGTDDNHNGLIELYEFTQTYPQISIDQYLEKSSDLFKSFVINGLQKIKLERTQTDNKIPEPNGSSPGTSDGLKVPKKTTIFSRVPPPQTHKEAIQWLKTATTHLGLDAHKYNDFEMESQLNGNDDPIDSIEAAEIAVQKAQEKLEKFKKAYANGQRR